MSGLLMRRRCPLALMKFADRVPISFARTEWPAAGLADRQLVVCEESPLTDIHAD